MSVAPAPRPAKETTVVFLCDTLEMPPRTGYQIHVTSLARAFERRVPSVAFAWAGTAESAPWLAALPAARAPRGRLARKRRYVQDAVAWIEAHAAPGSVLWVRGYSTALLLLPFLSAKREKLGLTALYDASSFEMLEAGTLAGRARGLMEEKLWGAFDRVRTLSAPMRDYLVEKGVPAERVLIVPVGAERREARWRPHAAAPKLLYVGGAADYQGLDALMRAMEIVARERPDARLSVVGPERLAGAPDNVEFTGRVPHDRVASFYLEHDLFVLPRPRTPLTDLVVPMKLPEAMSFGMPVLATDLGSVRWVLGGEEAQLVADNEPETLARGVLQALADPARLAAWGAAARERSERFSWDAIADEAVRALFGNAVRA
ncbi:MAG TPA: glycosyltransferase family 4 protein [Candidatus Eisenbacteria bacterium]|nr:glycosyltransferase family 4 protein [Candidatus Eisenbacteria bacterium]